MNTNSPRTGPEHPVTAGILSNLGLSYYRLGNLSEVEKMFRRAIEVRLKLFGTESPLVAVTSSALASVLTAEGYYDEARWRYAESIRVQEAKLGPKTSELATTLEQFARLLHKMKSDGEAHKL